MSQEQNGKSEEAGTKTEVVVKAKRRQYSAEYKLRILREIDECKGKGEAGALLRREGLYSSLVSKWREQRERGGETRLSGHRRGPKVDANAVELARLQRENKRPQEKLERAKLIIDVHPTLAGGAREKSCAAAWSTVERQRPEQGLLMQSAETFGKSVGVQAACAALIVPRSSLYRARAPQAVRSSAKFPHVL